MRRGYKTSAAQVAANKRAEEKNPDLRERNKISRLRSTCKRYIKEFATVEDIELLRELLDQREEIVK
ncbi:hypothetical protein FUSNEC_GEN_287_01440 [Fusobacterium necrophorum subsp. funduliforme]|uniref:hypothetical protein n=1 Tax=Fusobacterium necrophorum TaxID=859 RepID=UPI002431FDA5|nr:hypothetical protein [Fusobacterium necrophorum]MCF0163358.1 hypothetical protein [Fusobacterium necrophorum]MDK4496648.1 hypothetical protein [Fusobacterium necrophorum]